MRDFSDAHVAGKKEFEFFDRLMRRSRKPFFRDVCANRQNGPARCPALTKRFRVRRDVGGELGDGSPGTATPTAYYGANPVDREACASRETGRRGRRPQQRIMGYIPYSALPLFIPLWIPGAQEDVVGADVVEVGELDENLVHKGLGAGLDVAVFALGDADSVGDLLLGQVMVLPQVLYPVPHAVAPRIC